MLSKIQPIGWLFIIAIVGLIAFFGKTELWDKRSVEAGVAHEISEQDVKIPLAPKPSLSGADAVFRALPSETEIADDNTVPFTHSEMEWDSQNGWHYANGGKITTEGSLFAETGLKVTILRQDDPNVSVAEYINNVEAYKKNPSVGGYAFTVMGSGVPNYIKKSIEGTASLGADYQPVVFCTSGKSDGEDQVIGDAKYRDNPKETLKGAVCRGVRLDGDLDIAIKYAGANGVNINPNPETYAYDALNFSYGQTFQTVVEDYNNHYTETRKIVRKNEKGVYVTTGEVITVGIDMVATWLPGDVHVFEGTRGGVTIINTRTYGSMMPNITICNKKFLKDHKDKMVKLVAGLAQAGDQIKTFDPARWYVAKLDSIIFNDMDQNFWYTYFDGVQQGEMLLGGSKVFNLADMNSYFGINGKTDVYKSVYETFAKLQFKLYPDDFKGGFPEYAKIMDNSILKEVNSRYPELLKGKAAKADYSKAITKKVSEKAEYISFASNSDEILSSSLGEVQDLANDIISSEGLKVSLYGHTDNSGDDQLNMELSQRRAQSVQRELMRLGVTRNRFEEVVGYGETRPLNSNANAAQKALNRRVEVIQGN